MPNNTVTMYSKANDTPANNIAAKESWGHKKGERLFINSFVGTRAGGLSYVNSKTRSTNDQQGAIVNTGVVSDIGIDGAGLLAVTDTPTGVVKYTRRGDFRQDELGYWKNGSDQLLKAWKLDRQGNLPQNSSLLSSLEAVNFANTKGLPVKTSVISIAMNLNADQKALRGNGVDAVMNRSGLNSGTGTNDILFPEKLNNSGLRLGDRFNFNSTPPGGNPKVVEFGGMVLARRADNTAGTTIFGATGANRSFTFAPVGTPAAPGILLSGQKLSITVSNGATYTFTAIQGQESATSRTFNTINGLAAAIDKISALQARVDSTGRLYIAPTDANKGLTFVNSGGGNIVEELGLHTLDSAPNGVERFNSIRTLRDAVNKNQSADSLLATIENKDIKITSLLSTAEFAISGQSLGQNRIRTAVANPADTDEGRGTIVINAPGNNLNNGDLVNITGLGGVPDGMYSVSRVTTNNFAISRPAAAAGFPAVGAGGALVVAANASWQNVPGRKYDGIQGCTVDTAGAGGVVTVTVPGGTALTAGGAQAWANNNVVYLSGIGKKTTPNGEEIEVPDGYYIIANFNNAAGAGNATFDITPAASQAGGTAAGAGLPVPAAAGQAFARKVGTTGGAFGGPVNTCTTEIFNTHDGAASNNITYYIGDNHNYSVGDIITFTGTNGNAVDGIALADGRQYKITEAIVGTGFIKFAAVDNLGNPINAANGNGGNVETQGNFANLRTNNYSRFFEYFNIDQEKSSYEATYNANDVDKNLTSGNFDSSLTFSHPLTIVDSLGSSYTIILYFAKLDDNTWSVEVAAQRDENGVFDIDNLLTENGLLRSGIIKFDTNGLLQGIPENFSKPIEIQRNNGSEQSSITIDWENTLRDIKTGTVSQTKNPNNVEIVQSDGQAAGTLLKLEVDPQGFIIGTFDSGETRNLYQIPVVMFANVNGLVAGANGTFEISRESGDLLLKQAGVGGAGRTLGGVLEASNVDTTEELLKVQELSNTIRANARVAATEFKNISTVLSELNN